MTYWGEELGNWVRWEGRSRGKERLISIVNFLGIVSNSFYYVNVIFESIDFILISATLCLILLLILLFI